MPRLIREGTVGDYRCVPALRRQSSCGQARAAKGYAMVTGTNYLKRERSEARDGPAQVAKRRGFWTVVDGEEDPATKHARILGAWSARTIFLIEVVYVAVFVAGFASIGNAGDPLPDPYLAIAEILILVMVPIMVCLMLAIHQCAPKHAKPFTQVALGWMLAAAAFTTVVHFVQLTVARHIDSATFPGYARIFGWQSTSSRGTCFSAWLSCSPYPRLRSGEMQRSYDGVSFSADRYA